VSTIQLRERAAGVFTPTAPLFSSPRESRDCAIRSCNYRDAPGSVSIDARTSALSHRRYTAASMRLLIILIGRALAAFYQRHSVAGGIVGAVLGFVVGVAVILLWGQPADFVVSACIAAGTGGAFLFSLIGALVGPRPTFEQGQQAAAFAVSHVRLYRLNQALVPLVFLGIAVAL
jgi:hypothetical protein